MSQDNMNVIEQLRKQIDKCDDEIFTALRNRCNISYLIGVHKKNYNMPVVDNDRFIKMVNDKVDVYKSRFMDEDFIKEIYNVIHKHSCKLQA
jgi:chorismate mutase